MEKGSLYLIPNYLGEPSKHKFDITILSTIEKIEYFIFENEKPGRAFIKSILPQKSQVKLIVSVLNKFTKEEYLNSFLEPVGS